jgi:hypothetical protein
MRNFEKKILILIASAALLGGCAEFYAAKVGYADHAAQMADELLSDAIFVICKAAPVGAVERFFNSPDLVAARALICQGN